MSHPAECPECAGALDVQDDVLEGEIIQCAECGVELEVVGTNPVTVQLAPEEEEDWGE